MEVDVESGYGKNVHRARFHERLFDLIRQCGLPAQGHRLEEPRGRIILRQPARQRPPCPLNEPVSERHDRGSVRTY